MLMTFFLPSRPVLDWCSPRSSGSILMTCAPASVWQAGQARLRPRTPSANGLRGSLNWCDRRCRPRARRISLPCDDGVAAALRFRRRASPSARTGTAQGCARARREARARKETCQTRVVRASPRRGSPCLFGVQRSRAASTVVVSSYILYDPYIFVEPPVRDRPIVPTAGRGDGPDHRDDVEGQAMARGRRADRQGRARAKAGYPQAEGTRSFRLTPLDSHRALDYKAPHQRGATVSPPCLNPPPE